MKGVFHTVETVIVIAMLLIAIAAIFKPLQVDNKSASLISTGYAALQYLDYTGVLRPAAVSSDIATIKSGLRTWLTNFELEICNTSCNGTSQQGAVALDYFIAGYQAFQPVRIRLYIW